MKDRLIELLTAFKMDVRLRCPKYEAPTCKGCQYDLDRECDKTAILTDYLLANGVIVPPFELGSRKRLYYPIKGTDTILETKVFGIGVDENGDVIFNPTEYPEKVIEMRGVEIGKTVFLTKEEAEKRA